MSHNALSLSDGQPLVLMVVEDSSLPSVNHCIWSGTLWLLLLLSHKLKKKCTNQHFSSVFHQECVVQWDVTDAKGEKTLQSNNMVNLDKQGDKLFLYHKRSHSLYHVNVCVVEFMIETQRAEFHRLLSAWTLFSQTVFED